MRLSQAGGIRFDTPVPPALAPLHAHPTITAHHICGIVTLLVLSVQVPRELFYTASMAGTLAGHLGVFGHRPDVLGDLLAGRRVELEIAEGESAQDSVAHGTIEKKHHVAYSAT